MTPPNLIALVAAIVGLVMFALAAVFAADWKDAPRNACLILGGVACAVAIGAWVGGHVGEDAVRAVTAAWADYVGERMPDPLFAASP